MKWARAKTIFIYIFIFVNLFLFVVYRMNSFEGKQVDTASVVSILNNYGITASPSVFKSLPSKMMQIEAVDLSSDREFLEALMGENFKAGKESISSDTKSYKVSTGEFKNTAPDDKGFSRINKNNAAGKVVSRLKEYGLSKKHLNASFLSEEKGTVTVFVSYKYNEYPVYGSGLKVIASKEGISSITGKFFSFNQVEKRYYAVSPAESVLLDYLSLYGNKYGNDVEIKEINRGYFIPGEISSVSSYAIPTYEFTFSNGKRIFLDARENIESEYKLLLEN